MEPPSELEQENATLLAEQAALKRRVAALTARKAELERRVAEISPEAATAVGSHESVDEEPPAKGQPQPAGGGCD